MNKRCANCGKWKPTSEFHKNRRSKDGLHSYCKSCNAQKAAAYQKTPKGSRSVRRAIRKKAEQGYYRFGKGAISILKQGAAKRGLPFSLTAEQLESWWLSTPDVCQYCGCSIEEFIRLRDYILSYQGSKWEILRFKRFVHNPKHARIRWMTIDRKDNTQRYLPTNMAKACWFCNSLKNDFFSAEEMTGVAVRVITQLKKAIGEEQENTESQEPSQPDK